MLSVIPRKIQCRGSAPAVGTPPIRLEFSGRPYARPNSNVAVDVVRQEWLAVIEIQETAEEGGVPQARTTSHMDRTLPLELWSRRVPYSSCASFFIC